ncbi:Aste57867_9410 [Aphanomyces stellatus]|uniref:Aste57867_9410 protein n=1 Tax=Aphanomyces stellatus TaxID=120398 RepID=A0A485KMY3_9STRA|nr:hypothetical protein As57867_009374 [Aphanomyces stellatus]VFT86290.1 Aste57867_9410 [Aphanomyces stellatus]
MPLLSSGNVFEKMPLGKPAAIKLRLPSPQKTSILNWPAKEAMTGGLPRRLKLNQSPSLGGGLKAKFPTSNSFCTSTQTTTTLQVAATLTPPLELLPPLKITIRGLVTKPLPAKPMKREEPPISRRNNRLATALRSPFKERASFFSSVRTQAF